MWIAAHSVGDVWAGVPRTSSAYTLTLKVYDGALYGQDDVVVRVPGR